MRNPLPRPLKKSFDCNRCGISVIGLEVPHAHMHLIPINAANDLNFTQPKLKVTEERMKEIQRMIVDNLMG